jgi:hypothetical protein
VTQIDELAFGAAAAEAEENWPARMVIKKA